MNMFDMFLQMVLDAHNKKAKAPRQPKTIDMKEVNGTWIKT